MELLREDSDKQKFRLFFRAHDRHFYQVAKDTFLDAFIIIDLFTCTITHVFYCNKYDFFYKHKSIGFADTETLYETYEI